VANTARSAAGRRASAIRERRLAGVILLLRASLRGSAETLAVAGERRLAQQVSWLTGGAFRSPALRHIADIVFLAAVAVTRAEAAPRSGRGGDTAAAVFTLQLPRQRVVAAVIGVVARGIDGRAAAFVRGVARLSRRAGNAFLATDATLLIADLLDVDALATGATRRTGRAAIGSAAVR
jgi:hypothetical protein